MPLSPEMKNDTEPARSKEAGLPPRGTPKNYLMAWLLVMLKGYQLHGYEIMKALKENFAVVSDPGTVYRALRQLERDGYITSWWDPKEQGPARRVYTLTDAGQRHSISGARRSNSTGRTWTRSSASTPESGVKRTMSNDQTKSYLDLVSGTYGLLMEAAAKANHRFLEHMKSSYEIMSRPYTSTAFEAAYRENLERAGQLVELNVAAAQKTGSESAALAEKIASSREPSGKRPRLKRCVGFFAPESTTSPTSKTLPTKPMKALPSASKRSSSAQRSRQTKPKRKKH